MKAQRCECINITNNKRCLNKSKKLLSVKNKKYCTIHMIYYYNKSAIKIQSCYRSFKKRKYLNNIYNKLPCEIKNNILYFIKRDFYIEKLNKKIDNIVEKKINNYIADFNTNFNIDNNIPFTMLTYLNNNQNNIIYIYKLFIKYKSIKTNQFIFYNNLVNNLNHIKTNLYEYKYLIFNAYTNYLYESTNVLYYKLDKILNPNTQLSSES